MGGFGARCWGQFHPFAATQPQQACRHHVGRHRQQFSGAAESAGEIVLRIAPKGRQPLDVRVPIERNDGENRVARKVKTAIDRQAGRFVDAELDDGEDVLVNGSRGYLPEARRRYPDLLAVLLTVEQDVLRERLLTRGRETPEQIEARLARNELFSGELDDYIRLDNSASLERSVERLLQLLDEHRQCG